MTNEALPDLSITFCGIKLKSPFILSSGPLSYGAQGLIRAHEAGCGAVVTKTLRFERSINPPHHIGTIGTNSLINCEKCADLPAAEWFENEIPNAVKAGVVVIASIGHTLAEAKYLAPQAEASGARMIELVSYNEADLIPMLKAVRELVKIPIICKLSGNWPDPTQTARLCLENGADGLCAIDSIGPALKINIEDARPEMLGVNGFGWLSGAAIHPISLRINAEIALANSNIKNLYASGGCMTAHDAVEFMMVGASAVGICTLPMLKGLDQVSRLIRETGELIHRLGYAQLSDVVGAALRNFQKQEAQGQIDFSFQPYKEDGSRKCIACKRCETVCPYEARHIRFPDMHFDRDRCRSCGLCIDVCPTAALSALSQEL